MTQKRKALMDKEAFRLYPTFVQDREIFRRGFEYADNNPDNESFNKRLELEKEDWLDKACEWLSQQEELVGISFEKDFYERFKKHMEDK